MTERYSPEPNIELPPSTSRVSSRRILTENSRSQDSRIGLPGFTPEIWRGLLGDIDISRTSISDSTTDIAPELRTQLPGFEEEKRSESVTVLQELVKVTHDAQRMRTTRRWIQLHGARILKDVQIDIKRHATRPERERVGTLNNVTLYDRIAEPFMGFKLVYTNPTITSEKATNKEVVLSEIRIALPPKDYKDTQEMIRARQANRSSAQDEGEITQVGGWHEFQRWLHDETSDEFNPYAMPFEVYKVPIAELQQNEQQRNIHEEIPVAGKNAILRFSDTPEMTHFDTRIIQIAIWPKRTKKNEVIPQEASIKFKLPLSLSFNS